VDHARTPTSSLSFVVASLQRPSPPRAAASFRTSHIGFSTLWRRCAGIAAAALFALPVVSHAAGPADVFRQWTSDPWVERSVSLAELGITNPVVLQGTDNDARHELFLPVPAGLQLQSARLQLDADYLRGDGGRSVFVLSIDGYPVSARRFTDDKGDASLAIGVDSAPRDTGFIRIGASWSSTISDLVCADQRAPGNVLRILPTTRLRYRINRSELTSLATVWSTLPTRPVLLVADKSLSQPAYDAAWRIGLALERAGKHVQVRTLPAVGDTIDLGSINIPSDLRGIAAFNALATGGQHQIANDAEVGALLALGPRGPFQADIAIADPAMVTAINGALDALAAQMGTTDAAAFDQWRQGANALAGAALTAGQVALKSLGGVPLVAVSADGGAEAALLFDSLWKPLAGGPAITVKKVTRPPTEDRILLSTLGGQPGSFDVGSRSDWTTTFGIEDVATDGRAPVAIVADLSAAPDSANAGPVASLYLNDFLLGAQTLVPDGQPYRMRVSVPSYMLAARNVVRITFLRQLTKVRCYDQQTSYPVSVLPTSHIELGEVAAGNNFAGLRRAFAGGATVLIPASWMASAPTTLPRAIVYANVAGIPLANSQLQLVAADRAGAAVSPGRAFLAMDLKVEKPLAQVDTAQGHLTLVNDKTTLVDATGLAGGSVLQVVESGGQRGVLLQDLSAGTPLPQEPVLLGRGDVAVLGAKGVSLEVDSHDPQGARLAVDANPESLWIRYRPFWIVLIVLLVIVLLAARVAFTRRRDARVALDRTDESGS
jgi:hypothetical protein